MLLLIFSPNFFVRSVHAPTHHTLENASLKAAKKSTISIVLNGSSLGSRWSKISSISQIAEHIKSDKRLLIIFDIDNVLLHPSTDLGSDQWFSHLVQENIDSGMDYSSAVKQVLPLYFHVNFTIDLTVTAQNLSEDLRELRQQCEHAICLTARSINLAERTVEQLHRNNLRFHFAEHEEFSLNLANPALYKQGVLFCGMNNKGDVLSSFLDHIGYCPEIIIFIDDKEANLSVVENAAQKRGIEFIGLHYGGCDERVRSFDKVITQQELENFLEKHPLK